MSEARARVMVVDDSPDALEVVGRHLTAEGYEVVAAPGVAEAVRVLEAVPIDLVITDLKMPRADGIDLIKFVRANHAETGIIMITGYASIESAVTAVKEGAEDYLSKPFTDAELLSAVRAALEKTRRRRVLQTTAGGSEGAAYGLMGQSEAMQRVFRLVAKAAETSATVLVTGESGTGKELVARAIHYSSDRASAPFVPVNCAGIPDGLVESELFGHEKGAFTGAVTTRAGFFLTADGGTILLDEIGELALSAQGKLLRVLEDHQVQMVGATRPQQVDVRIMAATNKSLSSMVERGAFREDLFFRLNILSIEVPPLRERGEDVVLLIHHFAAKYAADAARPAPAFSDHALEALCKYRWPGNVRELENVLARLVLMSDSEIIDVADLPSLMRFVELRVTDVSRTLAEVEVEHIRAVLASTDGNKTRAAQILGIDRKTLRERLKAHGLS